MIWCEIVLPPFYSWGEWFTNIVFLLFKSTHEASHLLYFYNNADNGKILLNPVLPYL